MEERRSDRIQNYQVLSVSNNCLHFNAMPCVTQWAFRMLNESRILIVIEFLMSSYSTCSIMNEENEMVVKEALKRDETHRWKLACALPTWKTRGRVFCVFSRRGSIVWIAHPGTDRRWSQLFGSKRYWWTVGSGIFRCLFYSCRHGGPEYWAAEEV